MAIKALGQPATSRSVNWLFKKNEAANPKPAMLSNVKVVLRVLPASIPLRCTSAIARYNPAKAIREAAPCNE